MRSKTNYQNDSVMRKTGVIEEPEAQLTEQFFEERIEFLMGRIFPKHLEVLVKSTIEVNKSILEKLKK